MGATCHKGKGRFREGVSPHWFEWLILTEMYLTRAWKVDNISVQTIISLISNVYTLAFRLPRTLSVSRSKLGSREIFNNVTVI